MDKTLSILLDYCKSNKRVCPKRIFWIQLWLLLLSPERVGIGWQLSGPFIRAAWWHTIDSEKQEQFFDQIRWAYHHGLFEKVDRFIRSLSEDQWHHLNE